MTRQSEFELRKVSEGVFDKSTLMALYRLSRRGCFDEIRSIVSTGKESNVYHGFLGGREVAVKIYLIETSDFKTMERYIKGDIRFHGWKNRRQLIYNWAKKEFKNLSRVYGRVKCPKPICVENNVLVMDFIGEKGVPAPKLKDLPAENPEKFFKKTTHYLREMYREGLIHGDLSEYNILNWNEPVLIDFSMGVLLDHPLAEELLERDVRNILDYFRKFGIEKNPEEVLDFVRK
jgi:RIO kinase 1